MSQNEWIGAIAIGINIFGDLPYFISIFRKRTRPHAFSWLLWFLVALVVYAAQYSKHAGPGAWPTAFGAVDCFSFFVLALIYGEKTATKNDLCLLALALVAVPLWIITKNPLSAVLLLTGINGVGFYFTVKKTYFRPEGENVFAFFLWGASFLLGLFALNDYSLSTVLYPVFVATTNFTISVVALWRRRVAK